jgi:tRNA (cytidine/uridine-2'-O-)-methyltransferase
MLHIVLFQPEIVQNLGNAIRTCVAFNAKLHLIRPYGFFFNKNSPLIKRSSANHAKQLEILEYNNYRDFIKNNHPKQIFFLTRYGKKNLGQVKFNTKSDLYFVFGRESTGIDKSILRKNKKHLIRIAASDKIRSLNLANCVAIICYEFSCQNKYLDLCLNEPHNLNYLNKQ